MTMSPAATGLCAILRSPEHGLRGAELVDLAERMAALEAKKESPWT